MKESTKPRIGRMLGDSPSRKMDKVELRSCEKLACGRPGRRNRLPHLLCCPRVCKLGGAGGFACRANSSHLQTLGAIAERQLSAAPYCCSIRSDPPSASDRQRPRPEAR